MPYQYFDELPDDAKGRYKNKLSLLGKITGAIALSHPLRVRVRATVKLSAAFFNDESSITIGGGGTKVQ